MTASHNQVGAVGRVTNHQQFTAGRPLQFCSSSHCCSPLSQATTDILDFPFVVHLADFTIQASFATDTFRSKTNGTEDGESWMPPGHQSVL
jgi:hypothetical protein